MVEVRQTGEIGVSSTLQSLLEKLRRAEGNAAPPRLEIEEVRDVERGLGWRLPDDLLAVFAAHLRALEDEREMALAKVIGHTGKVRSEGARGDLVAVGKTKEGHRLCVLKGSQPEEGTLLLTVEQGEGVIERRPLFDLLQSILDDPSRHGEPGAAKKVAEGFVPMLVRRPLPGSPGQRVLHKVFGEGVVLKETGSGPNRKVKVDFPGKGLKLFQARFLQWLE